MVDLTYTTIIEFTPDRSGVYYFGFHDMSLLSLGNHFHIDNISISEKAASTATPFVLAGKTNNTDNVLNWAIKDNKIATGFEVQRSTDGINFTKIGKVAPNNLRPSNHTIF